MIKKSVQEQAEKMNQLLLRMLRGLIDSINPKELVPPYDKWFAASRNFLARQGVNTQRETSIEQCWAAWHSAAPRWLDDPDLKPQATLAEACLRALPDILSGHLAAREVLFPEGSMALVEGVHRGNATADYFNEVLGRQVLAYVKGRVARDADAELNILEVGAGVGGTTGILLKHLEPFSERIKEYCFTDLSQAFLHRAEQCFGTEYPYLKTRLLDIERPFGPQGIEPDYYDLTIAANVLHAIPDIRQGLRNIKAALHKHGLLLINELSQASVFTHLTFGLLDAWWNYRDAALRIPGCPGLEPGRWQRLLTEEGYPRCLFPAQTEHRYGQQIIVAESDGIVRQPCVTAAAAGLRDQCIALIKSVVAAVFKLSVDRIDSTRPLSRYGLDSLLAIQLAKGMRNHFDGIPTTLFLEVDTIEALADHLLETQQEALLRGLGDNNHHNQPQRGEQSYRHEFSGAEFFLREHGGGMPGVVHLALAAAAAGDEVGALRNIVWNRAAAVRNGHLQVDVHIRTEGHRRYFETTDPQGAVYCQGELAGRLHTPERIDLEQIASRCHSTRTTAECDRLLRGSNGLGLLTIESLSYSETEALARLKMPATIEPESSAYALNVPMLNGAVLAGVIWSLLQEEPRAALPMPFSLDALSLGGELPRDTCAYVRKSSTKRLDIDLTDPQGRVLVSLRGFIARSATAENKKPEAVRQTAKAADPAAGPLPIAIVGVSARLPEAESLTEFWEHLEGNRDLITEVPDDRWDWKEHYGDPFKQPGKTRAKWGGFIADMDCFDPGFFGLTRMEAETMDPQCRLFLEACWATLEDAGYAASALAGAPIGVFAGLSTSDYKDLCQQTRPEVAVRMKPFMLANRVSYQLDFRGPSEVIDTACSSSLVALHRAAESIRQGGCQAALAGGVNLMASPETAVSLSRSGVLSEDGRCMSFDSRANGMVRGEGVGVVLLKPLADAIRDGDSIRAVLRGSAENHDGKSTSAAAPNPRAQQELIFRALHESGVDPRTIGYIEAHGTGTELGDPIELRGLTGAFRQSFKARGLAGPEQPYCGLGSVKANCGHLEAAAGIAGVIKVLLMFERGRIPGNPHLREPNPHLELAGSPFYLVRETRDWPRITADRAAPLPRRAGLSSFGIGGTNAHVILEEYIPEAPSPVAPATFSAISGDRKRAVIVLSARNEERLTEVIRNLYHHLQRHPSIDLNGLAYTLQVGRESMQTRFGFTAASLEVLISVLEGRLKNEPLQQAVQGREVELLQQWLDGQSVDWRHFYNGTRPQRITLPTYPFARERYWIAPKPTLAQAQPGAAPKEGDIKGESSGLILCYPHWQDAPRHPAATAPAYEDCLVLLCGTAPFSCAGTRLDSDAGHPSERFEAIAVQAFETLRALLESRPKGQVLVQILVSYYEGEQGLLTGLLGLLKTASQENARLRGQLIELEPDTDAESLQLRLEENRRHPEDTHIRYHAGQRQVLEWRELPLEKMAPTWPWKNAGLYLITGGAGGLGLIFAREIAARTQGATLVLAGRSRLNRNTRAHLKAIEALGCRVEYRQVDVGQRREVEDLIAEICRQPGVRLSGILHCAGVSRGRFILKKSVAEFTSVLAPKVSGTLHLDHATRHMTLDFLVLFSSGSGAIGYPGQADYATANAFMDRFAHYRNERVAGGERHGHTLSINWPLWQNGGMRVDPETESAWRESGGMAALPSELGIEAFYRALASRLPQVAVLAGDPLNIRQAFFHQTKAPERPARPEAVGGDGRDILAERTLDQLRALLAARIKFEKREVDADAALEDYGIDSILILQLNQELESIFGPISKTLFFEYRTLRELSAFFVAEYSEECMAWTGLSALSATRSRKRERGWAEGGGRGERANATTMEGIAIIGLSCRFPQASTAAEFWQNLKAGKDCISELPGDYWALDDFYCEDPGRAVEQGKSYSKWGGVLEGSAEFDPLFFNISPREAVAMDPQERLFLQCAWSAVENAGYTRESLRRECGGNVGVFAGITKTGFDLYGPDLWRQGKPLYPHTSFGSVANRVSYYLDLNGPSMPIDTLCASSLTALHEACEHIYRGDCALAIAGGVNVYVHPSSYTSLCAYGFLAKQHRCRSFGQGGDGFVPGEGVGVVVLKPLARALEDHDHIDAVIRATSVNHDGKTNGYTVPNPRAQSALIQSALTKAGVHARTVSYVEAHGTGTELGDPIEVAGLTQAYRRDTAATAFAALGSVKSNIGHLEAAAGIAGLIKIILQMQHGQLVPSLHAQALNPNIDFEQTPFRVQRELAPWNRPFVCIDGDIDGTPREYPRIAAISSFGAGGANAHAIVEEYPPHSEQQPSQATEVDTYAIVLSAKNSERLNEAVRNLQRFVATASFRMADLAYTLQVGREAMESRLALLVTSAGELGDTLQAVIEGNIKGKLPPGVFSGQPGGFSGEKKGGTEALSDFLKDEDAAAVVERWITKRKLNRLLEYWTQGLDVPWHRLYEPARPHRISLPTYPFARERYWFDIAPTQPSCSERVPARSRHLSIVSENKTEKAETGKAETESGAEGYRLMDFEEVWEARELTDQPPRHRHLLCCLSDVGQRSSIQPLFAAQGLDVQTCSLDAAENDAQNIDRFLKREGGIDSLLFLGTPRDAGKIAALLRAFGRVGVQPGKLVLAGQYADEEERCHLEAWIGFERSLRMHWPETPVRIVMGDRSLDPSAWLLRLRREWNVDGRGACCYIEGKRYSPRIRPLALEPGAPQRTPAAAGEAFGSTVLITGGAGGLGLIVAEHLARNGIQNLILNGRSPLGKAQQQRLEKWRSLGCRVHYLQADVCDAEALAAGLAVAQKRFGAITGLIHAAGIQGGGTVFDNEAHTFLDVLAPKVNGTLMLDRLLEDAPLQTVCYFSSSSAMLGDFGSCDYAVGNRFLTAYTHYRNTLYAQGLRNGRALVINWPLWREGGMGNGAPPATEFYLKTSGQRMLQTREGLAAFDRVLAAQTPQHLLLSGRPGQVYRFLGIAGPPVPEAVPAAGKDKPVRKTEADTTPGMRKRLADDLKKIAAERLNIATQRLQGERNLADYGFDSLTLAEYAQALSKRFGLAIKPAVFYSYPTFDDLTAYFLKEHWPAMARCYGDFDSITQPGAPLGSAARDVSSKPTAASEPIAIVGMSGRFPQADSIDAFWENIRAGVSCITEIPQAREEHDSDCKKFGAFLSDINSFDPLFFEIPPGEANAMDPRQRLFLEVAWHAFEDAGYLGSRIRGTDCGVYVGVEEGLSELSPLAEGAVNSRQNATLAARIAYLLDLRGPNLALTTACSSALVALHQACMALRQGDCGMALVGGINLILTTSGYESLRRADMLSPDGRCRVFGKTANGLVPGEAVTAVLLKPLAAAVRDRDNIHACIKASAVNYDGRTNGITAPNPRRQAELFASLCERCAFDPAELQLVMAHSVGSPIGDSIEIEALCEAFRRYTDARGFCAIGSVKPLLGHTFAASGLVSLIAAVMAMQHRLLPGLQHEVELNPHIDAAQTPFTFARENLAWPAPRDGEGRPRPRTAAVGTTGISGTNAQVLIEESSTLHPPRVDEGPEVALFSARTAERLRAVVRNMIAYLDAHPEASLADIAYTLQVGREAMKERLAVSADSVGTLAKRLREFLSGTADVQGCTSVAGGRMPGATTGNEVIAGRVGDAKPDFSEEPEAVDLPRLALLWTKGVAIPWQRIREARGGAPNILRLPLYPFEKRPCTPLARVTTDNADIRTRPAQEDTVVQLDLGRSRHPASRDTGTSLYVGREQRARAAHPDRPGNDRQHKNGPRVSPKAAGGIGTQVLIDAQYAEPEEEANLASGSLRMVGEDTVVELYRTIAELERPEFRQSFLTFFPLPEKRPGFSITRVGLHPERHPEEVALIREKQRESREVLLHGVDFTAVESVLDFGCGYAKDIIELATRHPQLQAHGYTITPDQASRAREHIARAGLGSRVQVFNKDSTADPFPGRYDLALGIEVCCHIENKRALFGKVTGALKKGGRVLLMDFIANLRGAIIDPKVSVYIPTPAQWIELLTSHNLMIDEMVDLSVQIANAMHDPECEINTRELPAVLRDSWRNWTNNSLAIEKGWVRYCLFKLRLNSELSGAALRTHNERRFAEPRPYPQALEQMLAGKKPSASDQPPSGPASKPPDQGLVQTRLEAIFCRVLGMDAEELASVDTLQELGLSSLNAVALLEAVNEAFALDLPTSVVFEFGSIGKLAGYIATRLPDAAARPDTTRPLSSSLDQAPAAAAPAAASIAGTVKAAAGTRVQADAVAIIGMSCRCAGADDVSAFWRLVSEGREAISDISSSTWLEYFRRKSSKPVPARFGAMSGSEYFDPLFFHISPKEADSMGIVQRLLLEESYKALENAGHSPQSLRDRAVGTYIGMGAGVGPGDQDLSHLAMLGADTSIAAARIAFLLDLKGPALAVNTACSSSLVAIDLAVKALRNGEVDLCLAGGVTVWDHPAPFVSMNNAGMLSPSGECRPFDNRANGIVVGDGIGFIVLKRLADAERDRDTLYALVRASGTNQDGQTSGITVPSFLSQSRLQASLYEKAAIDVADLQYIEAHGTATKLGDPVEIHALTDSFSRFTDHKGFCAIGSVKANIGHTAAAAGVLGVINVVSALRHRQLPPSINFDSVNQHIDFENSPVYVNTQRREWPVNAAGSRLAAVSSFGYSGTNAHIVLEEYRAPPAAPAATEPCLIVLSARTPAQLQQLSANLRTYLQEQKVQEQKVQEQKVQAQEEALELASIAYTLQVGRDAMEHRVAFQVSDISALLQYLEAFQRGADPIQQCWRGQCDKPHGLLLGDDDDARELIDRWTVRGKLAKLAELWVSGYDLEWEALYRGKTPRRIALPGVAFARVRCRIPEVSAEQTSAWLHPVVQQNTSDLSGLRFSSRFNGDEFFLRDHQVKAARVLPGVVYLEMARAALALAGAFSEHRGEGEAGQAIAVLRNVVWARPIVVAEEALDVHVALVAEDSHRVRFEVYTYNTEHSAKGERLVHSQGVAIDSRRAGYGTIESVSRLDLDTLRAQTTAQRLSSERCYQLFAEYGVDYGPAHRSIEEIRVGTGQVLARLTLPAVATEEAFALHPSLMDGALQASVALVSEGTHKQNAGLQPMLPFALETLQILGKTPASLWAWIRPAADAGRADTTWKLDIDLCDQQGVVCVRMRGLSARSFGTQAAHDQAPVPETHLQAVETLICRPVWVSKAIPPRAPVIRYSRRLVLPVGLDHISATALEKCRPGIECIAFDVVPDPASGPVQDFCQFTTEFFKYFKQLLAKPRQGQNLIQIVVPAAGEQHLFAALAATLKTLHREHANFVGQLIEVAAEESVAQLAGKLEENEAFPEDEHIRYNDGVRQVIVWREMADCVAAPPWKEGGVYLITGGMGGLGKIFAREIAGRTRGCTLVLAGRTPLDEKRGDQLEALVRLGANVDYQRVDVGCKREVENLISSILERFGRLDGIFHSAGVIRDSVIMNKSAEDFAAVLRPKVAGAVNLDVATREIGLDLFVLFSSAAGAWGNPGQVDYATANAFMDCYAHWRNSLVANGERRGATLSVNWPLWKEGGMRVSKAIEDTMAAAIGAVALETVAGIEALYRSLASGEPQTAVMQGNRERLRELGFGGEPLKQWLGDYLKQLIGTTLKVAAEELDTRKDLAAYGLDSVIALDINNRLGEHFKDLPQTLFFEYGNIDSLADYLLEHHEQTVVTMVRPVPEAHTEKDPLPSLGLEEGELHSQVDDIRETGVNDLPLEAFPTSIGSEHLTLDALLEQLQLTIEHPGDNRKHEQPNTLTRHSPFHSFAPFDKPRAGFSLARTLIDPEACQEDLRYVVERQAELRKVLFYREDLQRITKVMDIGCGIGSDLITLALSSPAMIAHGLTVSADDARVARDLIRNRGLRERVQIFCENNTAHDYQQGYDLIFSIQTAHFITDYATKHSLFAKLRGALQEGGRILLAEYICTLAEPMRDPVLNVTVHTQADWARLLADNGLVIDEVIDVSRGVRNFLYDPYLDEVTRDLEAGRRQTVVKLSNQAAALEKGWVNFCLIKISRCDDLPESAQRHPRGEVEWNASRFEQRKPYAAAREEMLNGPRVPAYDSILKTFPEFLDTAGSNKPAHV